MNESNPNFESELRISPKLLLAGLVFFWLMLIFASDYQTLPADTFKVACLGISMLVISLVGWLLSDWQTKISRWFIIIALTMVVFVGIKWLESPVFLSLVVMPVAVAAILSGSSAATITAVGESIIFFLLPFEANLGATSIIFLAIWAMVGIIWAVYHPLYEMMHWSWRHFRQAQELLELARDRKVELHQTLDDLAHAYRELALLNERVTAMRLVAEEAQAAKTAFVAKVSHEFRTPLNMIIGLTDVLMDTPEVYGDALSPALLEDLRIVHRNCEHLSKMVNDILDLSQTEMGRLTLRRDWANLEEDIDTAVTVVRPLLEKKHLSLQVDIPVDLPEVYCDRTRIRQVILNLVSNAARFTDHGGITLATHRQNQDIEISVSDTGPGVSLEDSQRIFEPFYQGGGNPWRDQKGSGLGLSICKQFVELHGGKMWLESQPGAGSTFSFRLPIAPAASPAVTPARWINKDWVWHERTDKSNIPILPHKQRIVIFDETNDLYPLLTHRTDEIEFVNVKSPEQAIDAAQKVPAHAVVINTPTFHDLKPLIEQTRVKLPDTPIIAGAFPSCTKHIFEAGATDYLIKPVTRGDLENVINAIGKPIRCILIVDDDADFQQLLKRMLLIYDNTVKIITATNGQQALTQLRCSAPDLMFIDICMAGIDGWQTLQQKKQDKSIKDIPAIVISAQDPISQPMISPTLLATIGPGISLDKFLHCSLELSTLLLESNREPDQGPQQIAVAAQV